MAETSEGDSVFTKIIRGEIPSHKIYEDERVFAFLDAWPVQPGHVLVVPKHQVEFVWDLDEEDYAAVMAAAKLIARRLREVLGVSYVGSQIIGVHVPHAHVQLIPFQNVERFYDRPDPSSEPDHDALAAMAAKLVF